MPCCTRFRWWQERERFSVLHFTGSLLAVAATAYVAIVAVYLPEAKFFVPSWAMKRPGPPLETVVDCKNLIGGMLCQAGRLGSLQANSFYRGLSDFAWHNSMGHLSYLLGQQSQTGWWYYFPVVFLVKTPTADLLLFGVLLLGGMGGLFLK